MTSIGREFATANRLQIDYAGLGAGRYPGVQVFEVGTAT